MSKRATADHMLKIWNDSRTTAEMEKKFWEWFKKAKYTAAMDGLAQVQMMADAGALSDGLEDTVREYVFLEAAETRESWLARNAPRRLKSAHPEDVERGDA